MPLCGRGFAAYDNLALSAFKSELEDGVIVNTFVYVGEGGHVARREIDRIAPSGQLLGKQTTNYDAKGNMISGRMAGFNSEGLWQDQEYVTTYNDDGTYKIQYGMDNNVSVVQGMIQSFYDAPGYSYNANNHELVHVGSFYEELCEINIGAGVEYWYNNIFAVRGGYFNETAMKGNRKYVTLGAALKYNVFGLDVSYLIPVNTVAGSNPLENTLRFNLTYSMGGKKS